MKEKIDTQTPKDPGASFAMDGVEPVLSAWVAEECNRVSTRKLTEVEERVHADLARKAKERELEARDQFKVSPFVKMGTQPKEMVDARRVLVWKEVDGVKTARARLVAKGYRDPDLRYG